MSYYNELYTGDHAVTVGTSSAVRRSGLGDRDDENLNFSSLLRELAALARLMREEVLDSNGKLRRDVSLREARETFVASANLITLIAKSQETLDRAHNVSLFQKALVESLRELDAKTKGDFLYMFDRKLDELMAA